MARRIGYDRLKFYVDSAKYGNQRLGSDVATCWEDNTLQISADEQLGLMTRMYFDELKPFTSRSRRIVKDMMLQDSSKGFRLYYKTGWGATEGKKVLWIVGFAEKVQPVKEHKNSMNKANFRTIPYFFACNFDLAESAVNDKDWPNERVRIIREMLEEFGVRK